MTDRRADIEADEVEAFFSRLPRRLKRYRFITLFIVGAFLLVSYRTEVQQDQIRAAAERDRNDAFVQCQLVNDNALALNGLIDTVVSRIRQADMPADEKARAVALYERSKQSLPVCRQP